MKKGLFFTLAAALMMCFAACTPDNPEPTTPGGNGDGNSLVGKWKVDNMTYNGNEMTPQDMVLVMNANGTGDVLHNGQSENDNFTWSVNGNVLTVHPNGGGEYSFTIVSISATEASLNGNVVPGTDMQGDVTMHLTKVNGGGDNPGPDDPNPDNFLAGTIWEYWHQETETDTLDGETYSYIVKVIIRLHFNNGGQGIITEAYNLTTTDGQVLYDDTEDAPFTYTYNEATHSGSLTMTQVVDERSGETETFSLTFTYNASNNTLVIINPDYDPRDPDDIAEMVFTRINK